MESDLIRIEKLVDAGQYAMWKFQVQILLKASDVMDAVTGEKPIKNQGETEEVFQERLKNWIKMDNKAQRTIAVSIGSVPLLHIINCTSAKEMWDKLETVYEQKSKASVHMLQQRFYSFAKDPNDDIATHISKLEGLVRQLKDLGEEVSQSMIVTKVLMTLPDNFNHFFSAWESTSPNEQTMQNLTARLVMEESRILARQQFGTSLGEESNSNAFIAKKRTSKKPNLRKDGKHGKCFHCHERGHWKRDCPSRRHILEKTTCHDSKKRGDALVCEALTMKSQQESENLWYLDSGASDHMTHHKEWITNYQEFHKSVSVRLGNGDKITAIGRGDVEILAFNGSKWIEKHLEGVLYVPKLRLNLFSSNRALDKGLKLESDNKRCFFLKKTNNNSVVAVGVREEQLFRMLFRINSSRCANIVEGDKLLSLQEWHERLGHQNAAQVKEILKRTGIDFINSTFFCEPCIKGKQHRLPFSCSQKRATCIGELVHSDVCGPMQSDSVGGSKYFVLFKDDFSGFRCVYFIKEKGEVCKILENYVNRVRIETNSDVKTLRTDNGLEYINKDVRNLLNKMGIRHETTVPYTPEQNGRAERDIRTIVEAARTMIHSRKLSLKLWAEATNTAVYLLNRTGPSPIKGKSPFEIWFKKEIDLTGLKPFGTDVFIHIPNQKRRKWDAKSKRGIFVGYDDTTKGYRVWVPSCNKVEIARDVIFKPESDIITHFNNITKDMSNKNSKKEEIKPQNLQSEQESAASDTNGDLKELSMGDEDAFKSADEISDDEEIVGRIEESSSIKNRLRSSKKQPSLQSALLEGHAFVMQLEPNCFEDAMASPNSDKWKKAMDEEIESLNENHTWDLVPLPTGRRLVDNKWVYKLKQENEIEERRYKARLVARGFSQQYGVDYEETFSPVTKFTSIRTILAISSGRLRLKQFDVKTAFLNGELEEEIYMRQPKGYEDGTNRVCRLRKSLYGLKQASRCWNKHFTKFLNEFNFKSCVSDPCVFISHYKRRKMILALYIDDGLIAASDEDDINRFIDYLQEKFKVKVFDAKHFLGIEIQQNTDGCIHISQSSYAGRILHRFNLEKAKAAVTPANSLTIFSNANAYKRISFPYREAVGSLIYLAIVSRPDIAFAVNAASRYLENPTQENVVAVKQILKYISGTRNIGILFKPNNKFDLHLFSDADYAGDIETRRSTSGFVCLIGSSPVSWCSQRQKCVALSTTESEYVAASLAVQEVVWIKQLMQELLPEMDIKTTLYMDNQSAIKLIKNPEFHKKTKHIDVRIHFIREKYNDGLFELLYVPSDEQKADIFTKSLSKQKFVYFRSLINIV